MVVWHPWWLMQKGMRTVIDMSGHHSEKMQLIKLLLKLASVPCSHQNRWAFSIHLCPVHHPPLAIQRQRWHEGWKVKEIIGVDAACGSIGSLQSFARTSPWNHDFRIGCNSPSETNTFFCMKGWRFCTDLIYDLPDRCFIICFIMIMFIINSYVSWFGDQ